MVPCYILEGYFTFHMLNSVYLFANLLHFLKTPICTRQPASLGKSYFFYFQVLEYIYHYNKIVL